MKAEPEPPTSVLDAVLALQIMIAWAGEEGDDDRRLGWWRCKLTDRLCGADFFERTVPGTAAWAAVDAARRAATIVDRERRRRHGSPDRLRTLFFFGHAVDEQLNFRLARLKRDGAPIREALAMPDGFMTSFDRAWLQTHLGTLEDGVDVTVTPTGRQIRGAPPAAADAAATRLAAALAPLSDHYPMPFLVLPA